MRKIVRAALAAALVWAGQAQALTATAAIQNLSFTATDINPDNDVAPSFMETASVWMQGSTEDRLLGRSNGNVDVVGWPAPGGALTMEFPAPTTVIFATATGVTASALANLPFSQAWAEAGAFPSGEGRPLILISADTRLHISGELHVDVKPFDPATCSVLNGTTYCEEAWAMAEFAVSPGHSFMAKLTQPGSIVVPFSFYIEPQIAGEADAYSLEFSAVAFANSVPEPGVWLLLLLGLTVLAASRRFERTDGRQVVRKRPASM